MKVQTYTESAKKNLWFFFQNDKFLALNVTLCKALQQYNLKKNLSSKEIGNLHFICNCRKYLLGFLQIALILIINSTTSEIKLDSFNILFGVGLTENFKHSSYIVKVFLSLINSH